MQSGEPAEVSDSAPSGQDAGAMTEVAPPAPIFTGEATILWGTVIAFLVIFFFGIALIMHMNARAALNKRQRRAPGSFFQQAGEGAEITFDDDAPTASAAAPPAPAAESGEAKRGARRGLFGGGKRGGESPQPASDEATVEVSVSSPLSRPRAHSGDKGALFETAAPHTADIRERPASAHARDAAAVATLGAAGFESELRHDDEAARARRQVEEEFRRIEEERRLATARNDEFERRKHAAALEQERKALADRERAIAEQAGALERQIDDLRRDLAYELDARFAALAEQVDGKLARLVSAPPAGVEASTSLRNLEQRISALSEDLERRAASGAGEEQIAAIANLVARRLSEAREATNAAIESLSQRLDLVAAQTSDTHALRDDIAAMKQAIPTGAAIASAPAIQLSDIVRNALPPDAYEMRTLLSNNRRADCLVRLPHPPGPIAIDAQFPVEAFHRLSQLGAQNDGRAESEFRRAALRHIADVAERLISPGDTADSALMFIPSETIFTALHARFPDIIQDSYRAHVWIVSPTTLMAALHTMRAALGGASVVGRDLTATPATTAELAALAGRLAALEGRLAGPARGSQDEKRIERREAAAGEADVVSAQAQTPESGSVESAGPAPRLEEKDASTGDLWDEDRPAARPSSPFPLR